MHDGAATGGVRRAPLEPWSLRERLWLAMAVSRCGAQNWVSVSRALRPLQRLHPPNRFAQKNCAAQYDALLERCAANTSRRNKRQPATPQEMILKTLTAERSAELRAAMAADARAHKRLTEEIADLRDSAPLSEAKLRAMAAAVDAEKRTAERERALRIQQQQQHTPPPNKPPPVSPDSVQHPSPLLTSLLQTPTSVTSDSADRSTDTIVGSPNRVAYELQKIEQIKSELQKIEQNLMEASIAKEAAVLRKNSADTIKTPEKLDIDDIEIKAEDVYAFSDIDLDIPPVSSIHKSTIEDVQNVDRSILHTEVKIENITCDINTESSPKIVEESTNTNRDPSPPEETAPETDPQVLNPPKTVPDRRDSRTSSRTSKECDSDTEMNQKVSDFKKDIETKKILDNVETVNFTETAEKELIAGANNSNAATKSDADNLQKESEDSQQSQKAVQSSESHTETDDDTPIEVIKEDKPGKTKRDYSRKKLDKDDIIPSSREFEGIMSGKIESNDEIGSDNSQEASDKKILNRRFRHELGGSRSESPATPTDSLPSSPAPGTPPANLHNASHSTVEQDKDYRIWKKSVFLALNRLCALKYSSLFMRPITDDQAPGYSQVVKKPMDFSTIRRNIDLGIIKTTREFQRDIMLMLTNALMYNRTDHRVYSMAHETIKEAVSECTLLLQAQAHSAAETPALSRLTRPPRPASRSAGPVVKRKRGGGSVSGGDTPTGKKRRVDDP